MPGSTGYPSPPKVWTPDQVGGDKLEVGGDKFLSYLARPGIHLHLSYLARPGIHLHLSYPARPGNHLHLSCPARPGIHLHLLYPARQGIHLCRRLEQVGLHHTTPHHTTPHHTTPHHTTPHHTTSHHITSHHTTAWQAILMPLKSRSGGRSARQMSVACGQRGWKVQLVNP